MASKLGGTLFALLFAIPFGGVGAFATYGLAKTFGDSLRAEDWVLAQAKVDDAALQTSRGSKGGTTFLAAGAYRYNFGGRQYVSTQLGFNPMGGSDNVGDWHETMAAFMEEAKASGKTIPVYVNPDDPAEAVVDRDVRWAMVAFMAVFAVLFGGVGIGAIAAIGFIWFGKKGRARRAKQGSIAAYAGERNRAAVAGAKASPGNAPSVESGARKSALGLWIFAIVWNLFTVPMAILVVSEVVGKGGEWMGLLVLIFPLAGALVLWSAIAQTIALFRRGKATLALNAPEPRMGARFSGTVNYARAGRPGEEFQVRLSCFHVAASDDGSTQVPRWFRDVNARSVADPRGGTRVPFQFDVPARVGSAGERAGRPSGGFEWRINAKPKKGAMSASDEFTIAMQPALEAPENLPPPVPTVEERRNEAAIARMLGPQAAARMSPQQRAALAQMPADAQAVVGKFVANAGAIKKVVIAIVVAFLALQVFGAVVAILAS